MPESAAEVEQPPPPILSYVVSVGGLVGSIMLTAFGCANNAWVLIRRNTNQDELQRGIRGSDCYKQMILESKIRCLPWEITEKEMKFPTPFTKIFPPDNLIYATRCTAFAIVFFQIVFLFYAIAHCCSQTFVNKTFKVRRFIYYINMVAASLFILLWILLRIQISENRFLPPELFRSDYELKIGNGFTMFFFGGLIPFLLASICMFQDLIKESFLSIRGFVKGREPVPADDHEMETRA